MDKNPIENLMITSMSSLRDMIDVNTIIGDTVITQDGTTIIPVSKVGFGFASGGSEFSTDRINKYVENVKLPFGGGTGAGVNITPVAFLVVKEDNIKIMTINENSPIDKLTDALSDVIKKVTKTMENIGKKKEVIYDMGENIDEI